MYTQAYQNAYLYKPTPPPPPCRVHTGQGKLEKFRKYEWSEKSGKGQGKIFFWKKVREKSGKMKNWCRQMSDF